ncbi:hypothetical protein [Arachidicoccus sp.]|jgi:hypothetical protein|uniref:hypothetical protein n=1 Tax=Arachidicoccus sp. TaxID=1872624 RepID=UPI003D1AC297
MPGRLKKSSEEQQVDETRNLALIEEVRKYPALYDPSDAEYKDDNKKQPVWTSIAKESGFGDGKRIFNYFYFI